MTVATGYLLDSDDIRLISDEDYETLADNNCLLTVNMPGSCDGYLYLLTIEDVLWQHLIVVDMKFHGNYATEEQIKKIEEMFKKYFGGGQPGVRYSISTYVWEDNFEQC